MLPQSIRWRLPLSYAAIALFTTLVLGAVLLSVLSSYYHRVEKNYLEENAEEILQYATDFYIQEVPREFLKYEVDQFALFTQVRIRLLDVERNPIYDSGPPNNIKLLDTTWQAAAPLPADGEPLASYLVASTDLQQEIYITAYEIPEAEHPEVLFSSFKADVVAADLQPGGQIVLDNLRDPVNFTFAYSVDVNEYGVGSLEMDSFRERSGMQIERKVYDADGNLQGYLLLNEGPAFGGTISRRVARMWAFSSAIAVVFAIAVGWAISRRMSAPLLHLARITEQMAEGDLSVRADTGPTGEIGQLAHSFNLMAGQVEKTVSTLRQFVADAAHALHTPLTSLRTNLELLIETPGDSARQLELATRARTQTERLQRLTEDLLRLSRAEAQVRPPQPPATDLTRLLRECGEIYASWADQAELSLLVNLTGEPLMVPLDAAQLGQIVHNLLENAIKFTPAGGRITLGLRRALPTAQEVILSVQDTGIGVPPEDIAALFERFRRGHNAGAYPGHGLGLAIVRTIVESAGGSVQAENTSPGTCFTVRLPLIRQPGP